MDGVEPGEARSRLLHAAGAADAATSASSLLRTLVDGARQVAGAAHASLIVVDGAGVVSDVVTTDVVFERRGTQGLEAGEGVLGRAMQSRRPLRGPRLDEDPLLVCFPRGSEQPSFLSVPMVLGDRVLGAFCVTESLTADEFSLEDEELSLVFAMQAALAIENARLRSEVTVGEPALQALREVSQSLLEGRQTDDVLGLVVRRARELVGAAFSSVVTPLSGGSSMVVRAADGDQADVVRGKAFPIYDSISGDVMRTRRTLVLDLATDARIHPSMMRLDGLGSALFVPVMVGKQVFGVLVIINRSGQQSFSAQQLALAQAFASEAAMVLEYGQIRTDLSRLALLEERERIAMDLHDGVIQALFVAGLSLQAAEDVVEDVDEIRARLSEAVGSIDRVIKDLRSYIFGLRPADLGDRHLERALRELAETVARSSQVETFVELDPRAAVALASRTATVVQAAREAMSNAVRHSGASRILLRFCKPDDIVLEVVDNGHGFDPELQRGAGQGLGNLRARADSLGGVLEIESAPGAGTTVRIRVAA